MPAVSAPTSVVVGTVTCTGASVTFTNGNNSTSHRCFIYQSDDEFFTGQVAVSPQSPADNASISSGQAFTFPVVGGKYYSAIVRAVQDNEGVITSEDSTMSAGVVPTLSAPGAPTSVVVSSLTSAGAIVSWVAGVCTDSYNCQIIQSANSDMSSPSYPTQTPDTSTSVNSGDSFAFTATANYYYAAIVTAYNAIGNAASSISTGVQYVTAPNAPTGVTVDSITSTTIVISWTTPVGGGAVASYNGEIFESTTSGGITGGTGTSIVSASGILTTDHTFSITPVSGKYYGAIITAVNTGGSTDSVIANITPELYIAPPGAPTSIIRSALSGTGMTVSWTAPVGGGAVDSYTCQIYQSSASNMQTSRTLVSPQTPSNSTSVPESGVTLEQAFLFTATDTYYYGAIVTATNVAGSTASSTTSNFTGSLYTAGAICFKEDTKILCKINNIEQYIPIQALRNGDLVKTSLNDFKSIYMIGWKEINHIISEKRTPNQLYVCSKANFPEATEDLIVTGAHSILVGALTDTQREEIVEVLGKIYITGDKYRLPACVDERTTIYEKEGLCKIYHFALENDNYYMNYGIYANGILVETSSQRYLKEMSTMRMIE